MPLGFFSKELQKVKGSIDRGKKMVKSASHPVDLHLGKENIIEDEKLTKKQCNEFTHDRVDIAFGSLESFLGTSYRRRKQKEYKEKRSTSK